MLRNSEFVRSHQLVLRQFSGEVVHRLVRLDEFCTLLLSRRPLERCNNESTHCCGLFDPCTGELFDIPESELHARMTDTIRRTDVSFRRQTQASTAP